MHRFSDKEKAKALKLWQSGQYTQQQVADEIGCSIYSLKDWVKAAKNGASAEASATDNGAPVKSTTVRGTPAKKKKRKANVAKVVEQSEQPVDDIARQFWSKNYRAVNMLLDPKALTTEGAVKLVNEALQFAQNRNK